MSKKETTFGQLAKRLPPEIRICISFEWWHEEDGTQKWTSPLSDAQKLAYQNHLIDSVKISGNCYFVMLRMETCN